MMPPQPNALSGTIDLPSSSFGVPPNRDSKRGGTAYNKTKRGHEQVQQTKRPKGQADTLTVTRKWTMKRDSLPTRGEVVVHILRADAVGLSLLRPIEPLVEGHVSRLGRRFPRTVVLTPLFVPEHETIRNCGVAQKKNMETERHTDRHTETDRHTDSKVS